MRQDEWKIIYEQYQKPLFLYALSLTGNVSDAEDLLQETFVKAFLSYQNTGSLKYWLITVLKHEYLNWCRKRKRELLADDEQLQREEATESGDILAGIVEKEERLRLYLGIKRLPEKQREILMETVYLELSDVEIAKLHGMTKENVRQIRSRAKQKLIQMLKEES